MALVLAALLCMLTAHAAAAEPHDLRVGFDGVYRTGSWTPLTLTFPAPTDAAGTTLPETVPQAVAAWVEDPDGQYVRSPVAAVERGADGRGVARLTVRFGRPTGRLRIEHIPAAGSGTGPGASLAAPGRQPFQPTTLETQVVPAPIPATETVMLVLGDLPAAERASRLLARDDGTRPRVVAINAPLSVTEDGGASTLGRTAHDFDGADSIIVCGHALATFDPATLGGVDAWVRQGGKMIFAAGVSALELSRGDSPAAAWLPGPVSKLVPLRRGNAIETFSRANRPLEKAAVTGLEMPLFTNPQVIEGIVEAFDGRGPADLPLVVRRAHGLGTIVWVGLDLDRAPFRDWSGSDSLLVETLRGRRGAKEAGRTGETARGTLDLAGQLRQAIDHFPGVFPIPFEVIAGLGVLYVACLYPLDWWLVSGRRRGGPDRGLRSSWLAWLSLPLLVAAVSGLTWFTGQRYKGTQWQTSAASLIDLDVDSGLVRVASFAGIWSPMNARLDVAARPSALLLGDGPADAAPSTRCDVTWFAACGRGIGGTDASAAHPSLAAEAYGYGGSAEQLDDVPVAASSSRLFEAEGIGSSARPPVDSTLGKEGQGTLLGSVTNRLPFPLEACVLAHAGWLYEVGTLAPGQTFEPGVGRGPRSLAGAVTRRTLNKEREVVVRWDLAERDPLRILELAGFHAAAGGSGYTSLESGRLARFDLSPLLPLDRAVLMGRGPSLVDWECLPQSLTATDLPVSVPTMNGQASLWRIVIPLVQAAAVAPTPTPSLPPPSTSTN
jgi:hypothetical protein